MRLPRARVYIDGFNLYYGALKGTHYRWLDIDTFFRRELPGIDIQAIRYFSARIIPLPSQPLDGQNQQAYLRALETLPSVTVHLGHFLKKRTKGLIVDRLTNTVTTQKALVEVPEEKGTDVNIASYLLLDAMWGMYDVGVVVTNDSDLAEPIDMVKRSMGLQVGVLSPGKNACWPLRKVANFARPIRPHLLSTSQLPPTLSDAQGTISKPKSW